jgi:methionyl-tRNA formyltransferase
VHTLESLRAGGSLSAQPQAPEGATYAAKIQREDAIVDWIEDAQSLDRRVRACDPVPGATASLAGEPVKIWVAEPIARAFGPPGTIVSADSHGLLVACGAGALLVRELQRPGGKRMSAAAFLAGRRPGWPSPPPNNGARD